MTDNDRLRKEVLELADYLGCNGEELWSELQPLIAREVRLGKIEEAGYMWINFGSNEDGIEFNKHFSELKEDTQ